MEQLLPGEYLWAKKNTMGEYLKEPLNKKLYQVYLTIRRNNPSQHFDSLKLFNLVYSLCARVVYENDTSPKLNGYIKEIKTAMGWSYPTSMVLNMVYAVLSLRKGNSDEVMTFLEKIEIHYKLSEYNTPFYCFVKEERSKQHLYNVPFPDNNQLDFIIQKEIGSVIYNKTLKDKSNNPNLYFTINVNNQFTGEIKDMHVAHSDVAVGVAEKGANVYHHKEIRKDGKR